MIDHKHLLFAAGETEESLTTLPAEGDARKLNVPVDGGMVGSIIGVYATATGKESKNQAAFGWTCYQDN